MPGLSVCIIAFNEEKRIKRCLQSVAWADEIVVVDGSSEDRTMEICRDYTDRVYSHLFIDYAAQKNFALSLARNEWVLSVDADEEVTVPLKEEIISIVARQDAAEGYRIRRSSFIFGRKFRFTGTQDDAPLRLFRKEKARFEQPIHEKAILQGRQGRLGSFLWHYTYDMVSDYMKRFNRYTSLEAAYLKEKRRRLNPLDYSLRPFLMFVYLYFWKQGIRDGLEGLFFSVLSSYYVFVRNVKCAEIKSSSSF